MRSRTSIIVCSLLASALQVAPARAQDKASAEELFQLGKSAMAANDLDKACNYFQGSLNADFALGTLLNLAACHEQAGRLASAWTEFRTLEDRASQASPPQTDRAKYAHERAETLRPRLARVVVTLSPAAKGLSDLTVKIDGTLAPPELFEAGIPVDTGTHAITAAAAEREDFTQSIAVGRDAQRLAGVVPELRKTAPPVVAAPPVVVPAPEPPPPPPPSDHRTVGYVVGGAGAAALVTGVVFGLLALGPASDAEACAGGCTPDSPKLKPAQDSYDKANTLGWVSNVALVAGVVGLGVGTVLVLTSGSGPTKKTARLVVAPNGAALGAAW